MSIRKIWRSLKLHEACGFRRVAYLEGGRLPFRPLDRQRHAATRAGAGRQRAARLIMSPISPVGVGDVSMESD